MSYFDSNCYKYVSAPLAAGMMVSSAVGTEATSIQEDYTPSYQAFSYGQEFISLLSELDEIYAETQHNGWDGPNSLGVAPETKVLVAEFILKLHQANLPLPDICAEPDGELCLDWLKSRNCLFSVSISQTGLLSMLEKNGETRWHGSTLYKGVIPSDVKNILHNLKF